MRSFSVALLLLSVLALARPASALAPTGTHLKNVPAYLNYYYDTQHEIVANVGDHISVAASTGYTAGTYIVYDFAANLNVGADGNHNIVSLGGGPTSSGVPAPSPAFGGSWAYGDVVPTSGGSGGGYAPYTLPTVTPDPSVRGPLPVAEFGDSITNYNGTGLAGALQVAFPNAAVTCLNEGVVGSTTGDWLPGTPNFANLVRDINSGHVKAVQGMLGTNNAITSVATPTATYQANLVTTVNALYAQCPSVVMVMLQGPPAVDETASSNLAGANARLLSYGNSLLNVPRAHVSTALYGFFAAHPELLSDGVHPTPQQGQAAVTAYWTSGLFPHLDNLPTSQPGLVGSPDTFTPASGPFSGTITSVGSFIQRLIQNYGIPAILVALAVCGWLFVKRTAKSTTH